jgi:hypothetical protein
MSTRDGNFRVSRSQGLYHKGSAFDHGLCHHVLSKINTGLINEQIINGEKTVLFKLIYPL